MGKDSLAQIAPADTAIGPPTATARRLVDASLSPNTRRAYAGVVIMLNPSTADADQDDSTIRRLIGFAKRWGNGVLNVVNLYAYRSTDRGALINVSDPVGPDNDHWIGATVATAGLVVLAWGNDGAGSRARHVHEMVRAMNPMRIGPLTKAGEPKHPLYIPYGTPLESMKDYGKILDQT